MAAKKQITPKPTATVEPVATEFVDLIGLDGHMKGKQYTVRANHAEVLIAQGQAKKA